MRRKDVTLAIRISRDDRDRIAAAAEDAGLSQSEFIIRATIGSVMADKVAELERKIQRLEDRERGFSEAPR
jgi:uncharacterized protein (DUF1778 family)